MYVMKTRKEVLKTSILRVYCYLCKWHCNCSFRAAAKYCLNCKAQLYLLSWARMALRVSVMEPVCTNEQKKLHLSICTKTYFLKSFVFVLVLGRLHDCKHFAHSTIRPTFSVLNDVRELKTRSELGSLKHIRTAMEKASSCVLMCADETRYWKGGKFNEFASSYMYHIWCHLTEVEF